MHEQVLYKKDPRNVLLYAQKNKKDHITVMFQWLDSKVMVSNIKVQL